MSESMNNSKPVEHVSDELVIPDDLKANYAILMDSDSLKACMPMSKGFVVTLIERIARETARAEKLEAALGGTETALRHLRVYEQPTALDKNAKKRWLFAFEMEANAFAARNPPAEKPEKTS